MKEDRHCSNCKYFCYGTTCVAFRGLNGEEINLQPVPSDHCFKWESRNKETIMKNIERPEVHICFIRYLTESCYDSARLLKDLFNLGMPDDNFKRTLWLSSEYVEPHKWEPWELEAMKHIEIMYDELQRSKSYMIIRLFGEGWKPCFVDLPSIKEGETINIDEELERNGMHR